MKKILLILILGMLGSSMLIERTVSGERYDDPNNYAPKPPFLPFSKFQNDTIMYLEMNLEQWRYGDAKREDRFRIFFDDFYRKDPTIKSVYMKRTMGQSNAINGKVVEMYFFFNTHEEIVHKIDNNTPVYGIYCQLRAAYSDNKNTGKYRELQDLGLEQVIPITPEAVRIIEGVELWCAWFKEDLTNLLKNSAL